VPITSNDVLDRYADLIIKWRDEEGIGRRRAAVRLSELFGEPVTTGVVRVAFQKLGFAKSSLPDSVRAPNIPMHVEGDGEEEDDIDELVELRVKRSRTIKTKNKKHNKTIWLEPKPLGILVIGDPHVDNEGCDWESLVNHIKLVRDTEGVLAACVGDMQDNWIGRLAKLYCKSSVTASDGWRLSEWLLNQMQWIAIVGGNHDAWAHGPGVDPMAWLTRKCGVKCYATDELRITLKFTGTDLPPIIWVLRHDFSGRSWFHPTHGPHKEAMLDGRCHLLTAGHIHQWGQLTAEHRHSRVSHALRVRGYKRNDAYAREKGFAEHTYGESALVIIDPEKEGPSRISVFWDIQEGCQYLNWLRNK